MANRPEDNPAGAKGYAAPLADNPVVMRTLGPSGTSISVAGRRDASGNMLFEIQTGDLSQLLHLLLLEQRKTNLLLAAMQGIAPPDLTTTQ